jgi:DNA polymerase-3 subunit delta
LGDESELRMEDVLDAAGTGDYAALDRELSRLWAAGTSPVAALRQALAHFQRLLVVRSEKDEGKDATAAVKRLRPPVHFSREASFRAQVSAWPREKLEEALTHLYEARARASRGCDARTERAVTSPYRLLRRHLPRRRGRKSPGATSVSLPRLRGRCSGSGRKGCVRC